ncbi:MAG TPA: 2-phosphosulfolactate phosphatase [Acidobacteriota bacterium]|nr:2-phosphosulfolactate phosphatase [Acidobacteriota bacterium]
MHLSVSLLSGSRPADIALFGNGLGAYVVIDILRASTVLCTALSNGARAIIPVVDHEEALNLKKASEDPGALVCGERGGRKLPGFDLGNSPLEYTPEVVGGKNLIYSSTNGVVAIAGAPAGADVVVAGLVNLSAAATYIAGLNRPTLIACSGKLSRFALEDAVGAGALIAKLWEIDPNLELVNDGALTAQTLWDHYKDDPAMAMWQCEHGRFLIDLGFGADLSVCAAVDSVPVVPIMREGRLVPLT